MQPWYIKCAHCMCICYVQSTDSDLPRILLRKPRIRALRNNPRIAHANLGSEDFLRKPNIHGFCCANLGFARNILGSRNQTSSICGNESTIDREQKSSSAIRINEATIDRACLCTRSIVSLLPPMAEVWLRDPRRLRADLRFAQQNPWMLVLRSKSWDPRFVCAILGLLCKARIRGLHSKLLGWSESVICA